MSTPIAQFSGLASGIDSKSLIDAIVAAKQTVNDKHKAEITQFTAESTAIGQLNTKLIALNDLIDPLRTSNGGGVSKKATSSDATVATAVVGSNTVNASYSLTVTDSANSATGSFNQTYGSTSSYVSASGSGNVTITVGTGADQVVINAAVTANSTTLEQLAATVNADPSAAGRVAASVVNTGTTAVPTYKLVFTTLQQGTNKGSLALTADPAITELFGASTVHQATDSVFDIDGIGTITRATNSVSDVVSGVTFNIFKAGTANISIGNDADTTADRIDQIVQAFNDIVKYVNSNDTVTQDTTKSDRPITYGDLAKTHVDNDFITLFRGNLSGASSSNGTAVRSISEIGISTNRDGTLTFDSDVFKSAVANDPTGVGEVLNSFADSAAGVSGSIYQFTSLDGFFDQAQQANTDQINNLNASIDQLDRQTDALRDRLTKQFANLESITSKLQNQQQALSGVLAGLGR